MVIDLNETYRMMMTMMMMMVIDLNETYRMMMMRRRRMRMMKMKLIITRPILKLQPPYFA